MTTQRSDLKPQRRKSYIVDGPAQMSMALLVGGVVLVVGFLYLATVYVLPADNGAIDLSADQAGSMALVLNGLYFVFGLAALIVVTIRLSHRVVGPAKLIESGVRGIMDGDYTRRLDLREKDYLQELAVSVQELRQHLEQREKQVAATHAELLQLLANGETEQAERLLRSSLESPVEALDHEPAELVGAVNAAVE